MSKRQPLERLGKALILANKLHRNDKRKGGNRIPYIAHLLSVCSLVLYDGGTENEAIAALLHDALEDHPKKISREKIKSLFGKRVLAIVEECTDTPSDYCGGKKPEWTIRKKAYIARVKKSRPANLRVSVADKLDNACSMIRDYKVVREKLWDRFKSPKAEQLWYFQGLLRAYQSAGVKSGILQELTKAVNTLAVLIRHERH